MDDQDLITWKRIEERLASDAHRFDALREYVQTFFLTAIHTICQEKGWAEPEYQVRPPLGLRLEAQGEGVPLTIAMRPGWRPGRRWYEDVCHPVEGGLPRQERVARKAPGTLRTERIEVEVLTKPVLLHVNLVEGHLPKVRTLCNDDTLRRASLRALDAKAHDLLMDPMRLFSEQSDHCCCCGKVLTDVVSRTRGIGPECIRHFGVWTLKPPSAVDRYRAEYLGALLKP
jgi:hypothetical protein